MPKKNYQNEAVSSTKTSGSGLLNSGGRRGAKISGSAQPWAADRDFTARRRDDLLCSTALPYPAGVAGGLRSGGPQTRENSNPPQAPNCDAYELIPAPKLRAKLGISAVTLWRWRHDKKGGFPAPKVINGRLYFPVTAVSAWLARQADAA
jgi:predicted DNA-binding transcriptional regulator AlpA